MRKNLFYITTIFFIVLSGCDRTAEIKFINRTEHTLSIKVVNASQCPEYPLGWRRPQDNDFSLKDGESKSLYFGFAIKWDSLNLSDLDGCLDVQTADGKLITELFVVDTIILGMTKKKMKLYILPNNQKVMP